MKKERSPRKQYIIGIDLGGTKMLTALIGKENKVISEAKTKTRVDKGKKYFIGSILDSIRHVLREARTSINAVEGIGIGCPGIIDAQDGKVIYSPNIPFLKKFPLAESLSRVLHTSVAVENDVNAGLYGEFCFGAARKARNAVGIFIGTGIGGALLFDGKIYRGATGAAGEVGHMAVDPDGPLCGCGRKGCFEALASRSAIAAEAALLAGRQQAPHLFSLSGTDISKIKSGALAKSVKAGDSELKRLIVHKSKIMGRVMANLVNLLSPDTIVLGGGLVEAMPDLIVKEASRTMHALAMPQLAKRVKVKPSELGDYAIVMGAAQLVKENGRKNV